MEDLNVIVGYTVKGEPITLEAYRAKVLKAEEDFLKGNYVTHQEIKDKFIKSFLQKEIKI